MRTQLVQFQDCYSDLSVEDFCVGKSSPVEEPCREEDKDAEASVLTSSVCNYVPVVVAVAYTAAERLKV